MVLYKTASLYQFNRKRGVRIFDGIKSHTFRTSNWFTLVYCNAMIPPKLNEKSGILRAISILATKCTVGWFNL